MQHLGAGVLLLPPVPFSPSELVGRSPPTARCSTWDRCPASPISGPFSPYLHLCPERVQRLLLWLPLIAPASHPPLPPLAWTAFAAPWKPTSVLVSDLICVEGGTNPRHTNHSPHDPAEETESPPGSSVILVPSPSSPRSYVSQPFVFFMAPSPPVCAFSGSLFCLKSLTVSSVASADLRARTFHWSWV